MKNQLLTTLLILTCFTATGAPATTTPFIKIDQFGYLCTGKKLAIITDPINGYNAALSYTPGTGVNQYQLRRLADDAIVFTATLTPWNSGATHTQSGDRGWYFDFTNYSTPGTYYVYDVATNMGSYSFEIGAAVYDKPLYHAQRMFFYQRCNVAKQVPFADAKWTDAAAYEGNLQDRHSRSRYAKTDAATERDVSGGWFDAGDMNKYVTFAILPVLTLLESYRNHPTIYKDNLNLPESGNAVPDILDEIKFELDWLKKMQDATGTNGLFLKVGEDNYNCNNSPPSTDVCNRYYLPECSSSTICGAAMFAGSYNILKNFSIYTAYSTDLLTRARNAYARAASVTGGFTNFNTNCDDGDIKSGDADMDAAAQKQYAIVAAIYLYEATGEAQFKTFIENNYNTSDPLSSGWWGPYNAEVGRALLRYSALPGVTASVASAIRSSKANSNTGMGLTDFNSGTDLYRSNMPNDQYHWGSNQIKAVIANQQNDFITYNVNNGNAGQYKQMAYEYLHWYHGINPLGITMLTNMYGLGGDSCANEMYHGWFNNGTIYDNARTSPNGPPPGYVVGGPNKNFSEARLTPPANQPPQKSYKDWNTAWNGSYQESSYEITEPAIYYQAAYIALLAGVLDLNNDASCNAAILPILNLKLQGKLIGNKARLQWTQEAAVKEYQVEQSADGQQFRQLHRELNNGNPGKDYIDGTFAGSRFYRVAAVGKDNTYVYSNTIFLTQNSINKINITSNGSGIIIANTSASETVNYIQLSNAAGQIIWQQKSPLLPGETSFIKRAGIAAGMYFVSVYFLKEKLVEKLLVR